MKEVSQQQLAQINQMGNNVAHLFGVANDNMTKAMEQFRLMSDALFDVGAISYDQYKEAMEKSEKMLQASSAMAKWATKLHRLNRDD